MFSSKCISPGFSRFLSASTTHVAHSLKGAPAVVIPAAETVQSPPATLTNHSISKLVPTGNIVATTKHFGKKKLLLFLYCFKLLSCSYLISGISSENSNVLNILLTCKLRVCLCNNARYITKLFVL